MKGQPRTHLLRRHVTHRAQHLACGCFRRGDIVHGLSHRLGPAQLGQAKIQSPECVGAVFRLRAAQRLCSEPRLHCLRRNRNNVGMVQCSHRTRLLFKPPQAVRISRERLSGSTLRATSLQQTSVARPVHFPHSASTDERNNFVRPELCFRAAKDIGRRNYNSRNQMLVSDYCRR